MPTRGASYTVSLIRNEQIIISYLYVPPVTYNQTHATIELDDEFAQGVEVLSMCLNIRTCPNYFLTPIRHVSPKL
jgi:hypothetical protein